MKHGVICKLEDKKFGYFGWPTVARLKNNQIVVGVSGLRAAHICPWGKTLLFRSDDEARTWSDYEILNDTALDDRDVGLCALDDGGLLVTWFASDLRSYDDWFKKHFDDVLYHEVNEYYENLKETKENEKLNTAYTRRMLSDGTWDIMRKCELNSPHGPIKNSDGNLIYFGKSWENGDIRCMISKDNGDSWELLSIIKVKKGHNNKDYHEAHVIELEKNIYLGTIRDHSDKSFRILETLSKDGGKTWSEPSILTEDGSPPHLFRHSNGTIVLTYGNRRDKDKKYGVRAIISKDNAKTWSEPIILTVTDNGDMGYPSTIELDDNKLLTVYYQKTNSDRHAALLYTIWEL